MAVQLRHSSRRCLGGCHSVVDPPPSHRSAHRVALVDRPQSSTRPLPPLPVRPARAGRRRVPGVWDGSCRGGRTLNEVQDETHPGSSSVETCFLELAAPTLGTRGRDVAHRRVRCSRGRWLPSHLESANGRRCGIVGRRLVSTDIVTPPFNGDSRRTGRALATRTSTCDFGMDRHRRVACAGGRARDQHLQYSDKRRLVMASGPKRRPERDAACARRGDAQATTASGIAPHNEPRPAGSGPSTINIALVASRSTPSRSCLVGIRSTPSRSCLVPAPTDNAHHNEPRGVVLPDSHAGTPRPEQFQVRPDRPGAPGSWTCRQSGSGPRPGRDRPGDRS